MSCRGQKRPEGRQAAKRAVRFLGTAVESRYPASRDIASHRRHRRREKVDSRPGKRRARDMVSAVTVAPGAMIGQMF
jgi:hypothetical protein